ncbi:MAG: cache domain-containing protein [Xanthobacteraceae bacterium]|nr:cache domain-containing protein [Xanthobacteraceae bacterium]
MQAIGGRDVKNWTSKIAVAAAATIMLGSAVFAGDGATPDQAIAMVKKAMAFVKANGADKSYAEFDNKTGQFVDRDLYVVVYSLDGKVLAHGANEKLIGKDMLDAQDVDGKPYIKERIEMTNKEPNGFWQDYKFVNPTTKKVEPKQMYCQKLDNTSICAGVYK